MKAKDLFKWFIENQIENSDNDIIDVPVGDIIQTQAEFFELFFGVNALNVKRHIPSGEYFYIWKTENNAKALLKMLDSVEIILNNDGDEIWFFRIED